MADKESKLEKMLRPVVSSFDCELWGLDYRPQGRRSVLRVYIDKAGGVLIEDCAKVSRQISSVLDVEDPISGEYMLEVSSPGMDRPLFTDVQYRKYVGEWLSVRLRVAFDNRRKFRGVLTKIEDEEITLLVDGEEFIFPLESIDRANIIPQF